ncbi:uncharacterized protein LOC134805966 [Cydia splendana]|uniref:uncharacterized protein LOC134805966 n=1 Tax=Cydia splendana TaxID=1100963 RepID=UPI00300D3CDE
MSNETEKADKLMLLQLSRKRASAKGQITKFGKYLDSIAPKTELDNVQLTELNLKLAKFEALSVKVDELQSEIEVLNFENISAEIEERDLMEHEIIVNIATAKNLVERFSTKFECERRRISAHNTSYCDDPTHSHEIGLKLPQIQIAKFDGAYFRWLEFRDTFENLIHKNERISDIHKFHYLVSYLQGDAARIISNLEVSTDNYAEAWKMICNRYDNKRILINHHLNSLFNIKQLPRETERSLRFLVDHVTKNLRALTSLGQPTDKWDVLIIFMLSSKLDSNTLLKWEEYRNNLEGDVPTLEQFYKFMIDRADVLESLNRNNKSDVSSVSKTPSVPSRSTTNNNYGQRPVQNNYVKSFASSTNNNNNKKQNIFACVICSERHRIYDCPTFKAKGVDERMMDVSKYKLCINCLRQGHVESECRMGPCREHGCTERHNSLLHRPSPSSSHLAQVDEEEAVHVNYAYQNTNQGRRGWLSTAIIEVENPVDHQKLKIRAFLDNGSESSFITESLKARLSLKPRSLESLNVIGMGDTPSKHTIKGTCDVQLNSIKNKFSAILSCYVMDELTGRIPKAPVDITSFNLPQNIELADPMFYQPGPIDVVIGADMFWDILGHEEISLGPNNPKLRSSKFGWIVCGRINSAVSSKKILCNHAIVSSTQNENIENLVSKFWDLEEVPKKQILSKQESECEKHFLTHTIRVQEGRFCVNLPLKESVDCLGDSYNTAKKRFLNLEKRFKRNPTLKCEYTKFINEYADLGHLSISNVLPSPSPSYYLCHHAIIKEERESTKLRVVFDGSSPTTSGYSLNDVLMVGPNVQDTLFSILIRARQYKYLLTGDIEKMYRQVLVSESDRNLQLILWREDESKPIQTLVLNTLTYGTASASYLSTRCLWELGQQQDDVLIKTIIQKDFYVDDLITGANDPQQLIYIQKSVSNALKSGCFNLRKYKSNHPSIFDNLDINKQDNLTISESSSTLGLGWTPSSDTLHFPIKMFSEPDAVITKRIIMSNSFKIFDPLGVLSPVIVIPKIMLQKLWEKKLDWDSPVPSEIKNDWIRFSGNLKILTNLNIPRWVLGDSPKRIEFHSFSDASQSAYGACIYVKSIGPNEDVTVKLLCAKSKIAPIKFTSIPRLELCAALVAAKLTQSVLESLRYKPDRIVHWCDSSVVLGWIKGDISRLKTFVANRIGEIVELTSPQSWRYVPTDLNPADFISRGVDPKNIMSLDLWWSGPNFLLKNEDDWPVLKVKDSEPLPELKVHSAVISEPIVDFERFSSCNRLIRSFAYVQRFMFNTKNSIKRTGILTADELRESWHSLCIIAQSQSFSDEYESLLNNKPISNKSKILCLSPFLDNKIMRVGGRLDATDFYSFDKKHPILLHASHRLTRLYFEREHIVNMHAGPLLLFSTVRETVWPVNGRHLAWRVVNNCVRCRRLRGKTLQPKMGNLPSQRITPDYPFLSVGLDFAGPFTIINRKGRGSRLIKCYLCLFVCLRYKCIHLEAVSDLTKDAFIMTLRRFIARRGRPTEIFSDNGTNFVAAAKELGSFIKQNQEPLFDFASQNLPTSKSMCYKS